MLPKIGERLSDRAIEIEATPEAIAFLAQEGHSEEFGARHLRRTVQKAIEDRLSEGILAGDFMEGDDIVIGVHEDEIAITTKREETEPPLLEAMVNV